MTAAGVRIIFLRATGYQIVPGRDLEFGTSTLYSTLSTDTKNWKKRSTYTKAQPGDVIITATGKQAGHAGIVSDGTDSDGSLAIISNGSRGFRDQPETAGTIQQNYSISRWKEVASRNPTQTAAFEYIVLSESSFLFVSFSARSSIWSFSDSFEPLIVYFSKRFLPSKERSILSPGAARSVMKSEDEKPS